MEKKGGWQRMRTTPAHTPEIMVVTDASAKIYVAAYDYKKHYPYLDRGKKK